jgi:hypothetical protein
MGRKADSPTPWWSEEHGCWVVRVTLPRPAHLKPGTPSPRRLVKLETDKVKIAQHETEKAERYAKLAVRAVREGRDVEEDGDSVSAWAVRRYEWLEGRPRAETLPERKRRWIKWVDPILGLFPIVKVSADDIRRVVKALEDAVSSETIAPKTAQNIWGEVTRAFADACEANDPTVRVRADNPCDRVRGPEKGDERSKPFLRPSEVVTLLTGKSVVEGQEDVPRYRRELYAVAIYTAGRAGELRALTPADVDFDAMQITIAKQVGALGMTGFPWWSGVRVQRRFGANVAGEWPAPTEPSSRKKLSSSRRAWRCSSSAVSNSW